MSEVPRTQPNVQPASAPAIYAVSGLNGTPDERMRKIDDMKRLISGHVTIIELPDTATLNRLA